MDVDVVCVGFGPATGGFLTTLGRAIVNEDGSPRIESRVMPGAPLQILCFERADDVAIAVEPVGPAVERQRGIVEPHLGVQRLDIGGADVGRI